MIDIGDVVPLSVLVYDDDVVPPVLANAGTVVLTVVLPDGTTVTPTVTNSSTGLYEAEVPATQSGTHKALWVATGVNASARTGSYDVASDIGDLISLEDAKHFLNKVKTTDEEELRIHIRVAAEALERWCGRCFRRATFTDEVYSGTRRRSIPLRNLPILEVTDVTELGVTLTVDQYTADTENGILTRLVAPYKPGEWAEGYQNVEVTYTAGYADVPDIVTHANRQMLKHLWTTQRGNFPTARAGQELTYEEGTAWSYPRAVRELVESYQVPGF